jgi:hypothetical protein
MRLYRIKNHLIAPIISFSFGVCAVLAAGTACAQLPGTDIWLAPLSVTASDVRVGAGTNATRRPGYDNQPAFIAAGAFLYAAGDSSGTDIWRWEGGPGGSVRVTRTPESEYSPTPLPAGAPGFCAVRVEADSTQRLWRFDPDGGNPRLVMADVDSVGYFEWMNASKLALFVLGEPHTLRIVDVASQRETVVARDIGRFIRCVPGSGDLCFSVRVAGDRYRFFRLPDGAREAAVLIDAPGGGQDAVWVGDVLLASGGTEIFLARPSSGVGWERIADVRDWGAASVSRLAVSPDHATLAAVCGE